ncbi:MAG: hypothetical protein LUC43_03680, partial [Burkholderiales bacterium]|nr:hypothetical protein [Burkholderiales bacterium]
LLPLENCSEASRQSIFKLFLFTLIMRVRIQMKRMQLETLEAVKYSFFQPFYPDEEMWLKVSERSDNPWFYPCQPRIPGLQLLFEIDIPKGFFMKLNTRSRLCHFAPSNSNLVSNGLTTGRIFI